MMSKISKLLVGLSVIVTLAVANEQSETVTNTVAGKANGVLVSEKVEFNYGLMNQITHNPGDPLGELVINLKKQIEETSKQIAVAANTAQYNIYPINKNIIKDLKLMSEFNLRNTKRLHSLLYGADKQYVDSINNRIKTLEATAIGTYVGNLHIKLSNKSRGTFEVDGYRGNYVIGEGLKEDSTPDDMRMLDLFATLRMPDGSYKRGHALIKRGANTADIVFDTRDFKSNKGWAKEVLPFHNLTKNQINWLKCPNDTCVPYVGK